MKANKPILEEAVASQGNGFVSSHDYTSFVEKCQASS